MTYQLSYNPQYENNFQYRQCLRDVFDMNVTKNQPKPDPQKLSQQNFNHQQPYQQQKMECW